MIDSHSMRLLEKQSGIPETELMENAARGIVGFLQEKIELKGKRVLIVAYQGNNGGDGLAAARMLSETCEVHVLFLGDEERMTPAALSNLIRLQDIYEVQIFNDIDVDFDEYDVVIDAIFGTGMTGEIAAPIANAIDGINGCKAFKVSIDVPSGINPNTGEKANCYVKCDAICALHDMKQGIEGMKDIVAVVDIGLKKE